MVKLIYSYYNCSISFLPVFTLLSSFPPISLILSSSGHCCLPGTLLGHLPHKGVSAAEDPRSPSEDHADGHARNPRAWSVCWSQPRPVPQLLFQSISPGGRRSGAARRQRPEPRGAEKRRILSWRGWQSGKIKEKKKRERSVSSPQNVLVCVEPVLWWLQRDPFYWH